MSAELAQPVVESVTIPYGWTPRQQQMALWSAMCNGTTNACVVWHRRFGKSLFWWNWLIRCAVTKPGLYWDIFPQYSQAKKIIWEGYTNEGRKFLDYIPPQILLRKREDEMSVWVQSANGMESKIQLIGADNPDSLRGSNPLGVVFEEFSVMDPIALDIISPILAANGGWKAFVFTPAGHNHAKKLFDFAKSQPDWFCELLTVDDTKAVPMELINADRARGMPEELIQQEYWCSWDTALVGAYYGDQLAKAREEGRIGDVPHDPRLTVVTSWDLGISDKTAIWFMQQKQGGRLSLIDYYEAWGKPLDHYTKVLSERPYTYSYDLVPHDAGNRMLTGKTPAEMLQQLGRRTTIVPRLGIMDGILAVRSLFPRMEFDAKKCEIGLRALHEYTKKYDRDKREYLDTPAHSWASHGADSLRYLATGIREVRPRRDRLRTPSGVV